MSHKNNNKRVRNMQERNVGMKIKIPKNGITKVKVSNEV